MIRVILEKITSTHSNLRTDVVEGLTDQLPQKGYSFCMQADSLTGEEKIRVIRTSPIVEVNEEAGLFRTENSTYRLTRLPKKPPDE